MIHPLTSSSARRKLPTIPRCAWQFWAGASGASLQPILPYCHRVWSVLRKPFVKGASGDILNSRPFKYAWIDTNWRPS